MKNFLVIGIVLALVLVGGVVFALNRYGSNLGMSQPVTPSETTTNSNLVYGPFEGNMPCADCSGIKTVLTLTKDGPNTDEGHYVLTETYEGKDVAPYVTKGNWTMIKGTSTNPNASVFELNPDSKSNQQYYLKISDTQIKPLDSQGNEIDSPFDMTMTKTSAAPAADATSLANPASQNCIAKGGTLTMQQRGDGGEYGLCNFEDAYACEEWALMRGDCPANGVKTTGYDTVAQKYCAWVGGSTLAVANAQCTFKDGSVCSDEDLFNGKCQAPETSGAN